MMIVPERLELLQSTWTLDLYTVKDKENFYAIEGQTEDWLEPSRDFPHRRICLYLAMLKGAIQIAIIRLG